MSGEIHTPGPKSTLGAIFGVMLIAVALFISVPVAVNMPDSWVGAVLALSLGGIGVAFVATHLRLVRRSKRQH